MSVPRPAARFMCVCRDAVLNLKGNYWELHDLYHTVWIPPNVNVIKSMWCYAQFTGGVQNAKVCLEIHRLDLANPKRSQFRDRSKDIDLEFSDTYEVIEEVVELKEFPIGPGLYEFRLVMGPTARRRLDVRSSPPGEVVMRDNERIVGDFITKKKVRPAHVIDCSTWTDHPGEAAVVGDVITKKRVRPAHVVDCSKWGVEKPYIKITFTKDPSVTPVELEVNVKKVMLALNDLRPELMLSYDIVHSRLEGGVGVVVLKA